MTNKNTNVLSLEASKAIANLGVRVESEKDYIRRPDGTWIFQVVTEQGRVNLLASGYEVIRAPNLQEIFSAMPEIGKVLGWSTYTWTSWRAWHERSTELRVHQLLDTYLSGGMEAVSAEIINLINENCMISCRGYNK